MKYTDVNADTIDRWSRRMEWGRPVSAAEYAAAIKGEWFVVLHGQKFRRNGFRS